MKQRFAHRVLLCIGLALTAGRATAAAQANPAASPRTVAFVGANVVPMDRERVLQSQTVIVRDGRIAEIGPAASVRVPAGAVRIDAQGKYLMPGLAEMHAHIPPPQAGEKFVEDVLFLYLANGVTMVRGMLGHPQHLVLRERAAKGDLLSPRIYTSGPSLNGNSVQSPEAVARMVADQKAAGYDLLKLHPGLSRAEFDSIDAAADRVGIPYAGHVSADVGLRRTFEAGQASVDHLDGYIEALIPDGSSIAGQNPGLFGINFVGRIDESRIPALAAATREAGVWNVPTESLIEHLASPEDPAAMARRPEMRYMPPKMVAQWVKAKQEFQAEPSFSPETARRFVEVRQKLIKGLHDAGAGLLLGSDAPQIFNVPGFAVHHELPMLVAAGLTPYQALETGTRNAARYFDALDDWGTVEKGKRADLILLEANPLENVGNAAKRAGVMIGGRWVPEAEIQQRLDAIAASVQG